MIRIDMYGTPFLLRFMKNSGKSPILAIPAAICARPAMLEFTELTTARIATIAIHTFPTFPNSNVPYKIWGDADAAKSAQGV
ncbi:MAG: hypothetical protein MR392_14695 [Roseburia sp.]|nr:hypothetical protein [Roseburia sp.]